MIKHHAQAHLAGTLNAEGLPWSYLTLEPIPLTTLQICLQEFPVIAMSSGMFSLIIGVLGTPLEHTPGEFTVVAQHLLWAGPLTPVRTARASDNENSC